MRKMRTVKRKWKEIEKKKEKKRDEGKEGKEDVEIDGVIKERKIKR